MIEGYGAVTQALLGTLLTWGMTAAGAGLVVFLRGNHVRDLKVNSSRLFTNKWKLFMIVEKNARCVIGIFSWCDGCGQFLVTTRASD